MKVTMSRTVKAAEVAAKVVARSAVDSQLASISSLWDHFFVHTPVLKEVVDCYGFN